MLSLVLALPFALTSCLESEEIIEIHEDGSADVVIVAEGNAWDFADSYPLPTGEPWFANDYETSRWMEAMASGLEDAWLPPMPLDPDEDPWDQGLTLGVRGTFGSVEEMPEWFAPESDPYAHAFQRRTTTLTRERKAGRSVYTFERVFHRRDPLIRSLTDMVDARLAAMPESIRKKTGGKPEDKASLTDTEWEIFGRTLRDVYFEGGRRLGQQALLAVFTRGNGDLDPRAALRLATECGKVAAACVETSVLRDYVERAWRGELQLEERDPVETFDRKARVAMRGVLTNGLDGEGVPIGVRNAVVEEFETRLTQWDQAEDLRDEEHTLKVSMPGVVVGGNFDDNDGGVVSWTVSGEDLLDGDAVMRVVSVVE